MAKSKSILPIVAIIGAGALFLASSGSAKASSSQKIPPLDENPAPQEMPPTNTGDKPKDDNGGGWQVEPATGITNDEKQAVWWALNVIGTKVDSEQVPYPYNEKKPSQSMLDWKTNIAYWMSYASPQSPYVKAGNTPAPFKIEQGKPDATKWAAIWLKIRDYIKSIAPNL